MNLGKGVQSHKKSGGELCIHAELTRLSVYVHFRCVCVCVCARASDVCVCVCVCVCVRALQMYAQKTSHTALDCYSNNPERLLCSPSVFGQSLYRVLIREIERECTRWW